LRRTDRAASPNKVYRLGDLALDPARREVTVAGQPIDLRTKEFDCLLCLAEHKGFVLSREKLLELAWGYDFAGQTRTVDVHVAHLRKKISHSTAQIETITGVGYKLVG
jgi:two-component system alkaline phosphatase synthesis response regulator PhoP